MKRKRRPLDEFEAEEALREREKRAFLRAADDDVERALEAASRQEEQERHFADRPPMPDADLAAPAWRDDFFHQEVYAFSVEAYRRFREQVDRGSRGAKALRRFAIAVRDVSARLAGAMSIEEFEDDAVLGLAIAYFKRAGAQAAAARGLLERVPAKALAEDERSYFEKKLVAVAAGIERRVRLLRERWNARFGRPRDE